MPTTCLNSPNMSAADRLRQLHAQGDLPSVLDIRTKTAYNKRHLTGSTNIELQDILRYCFLLPVPTQHFIVILPRPQSYSLVPQRQAQQGNAVFLRGHTTVQAWVLERWTAAECWVDDQALWAAAAELGMTESGPADPTSLTRLFAPSPALAGAIGSIEAAVAQRHATKGACVTAQCLDLGCGSGRDMMWLAARAAVSGTLPRVRWQVTGVDAWAGALERAHDLSAALQLPAADVTLVFATISSESGKLQLQQLPTKSRLRGAAHATVLAATPPQHAIPGCSNSSPAGPNGAPVAAALQHQYDLIVCIRFLERSMLPRLPLLLKPGGFIIYSTFVDGPGLRAFGRPSGIDNVLRPGELAQDFFGPAQGFVIVRNSILMTVDGRELADFVAQLAPGGGAAVG